MCLRHSILFLTLIAAAPQIAVAQVVTSTDGRRQLTAVQAPAPPVIDGVLDEEVWQRRRRRPTDFVQADPLEGAAGHRGHRGARRLRRRLPLHRRALPRQRSLRHRRQRNPQGLRRPRSGHLRGAARHLCRSPQRLRVRDQCRRAPRPTRRSPTKAATSTRTGTRCGGSNARKTADGWTAEFRIPFKTLRFEAGRGPELGHQLRAPRAPQERGQLLVAGVARVHDLSRVSAAAT